MRANILFVSDSGSDTRRVTLRIVRESGTNVITERIQ